MTENLLDLPLRKVLEKFGKGEHVPGSGSAAALFSLISTQLSQTVLLLSTDEKRKPRLGSFQKRAETLKIKLGQELYPQLSKSFLEDSNLFDKAIMKRRERDNATTDEVKNRLDREALQALIPATNILIDIAELSKDLAFYAAEIFDEGFHAARGDSHAALMSANATLGSCLSILNLNLTSFRTDKWVLELNSKSKRLAEIHDNITEIARKKLQILEKEVENRMRFHEEIDRFLDRPKKWYSETEIEEAARALQNIIWRNRKVLKRKASDTDYLDVLKPKSIIKALGYEFEKRSSLGYDDHLTDRYEIAGIINRKDKRILIDEKLKPEVQNFTAAHELAHAIFHEDEVMHRDKPRDGVQSVPRERKEWEADKFAAYFLMPTKRVLGAFQERFGSQELVFNEDNVFAFTQLSVTKFYRKYPSNIDRLRLIASVSDFGSNSFESLAKMFGVSVEAMAIRLKELNLVKQ